jgi:hypothetical protein
MVALSHLSVFLIVCIVQILALLTSELFKNVNMYDTIIQWQTLEKASSIWQILVHIRGVQFVEN